MSGPYWTDTFNPVVGCTQTSPGCANCWARSMHERFHATPFSDVRTLPEVLSKPLRRRKPTTYFVCNTSDLFHPSVSFEFVAAVYGVMAATPQHTYLTCTKRPERRAEFMRHVFGLEDVRETVAREASHHCGVVWDSRGPDTWRYINTPPDVANRRPWPGWPLPNVWEGVTVEDQERADERLPGKSPDWISVEPLLGPIDFGFDVYGAKQVIVGGESGPNARPCDVAWIRDIVRQCREADVRCFVKQLGSKPFDSSTAIKVDMASMRSKSGNTLKVNGAGSDPSEWPEDLRVRELGWSHE